MVLFQKLTPPHVETTMVAFSASVFNISLGLIGQMIGVGVNKLFFGVSEKDMSKYPLLGWMGVCFTVYEYLLIRIIPTNKEIDATVRQRKA